MWVYGFSSVTRGQGSCNSLQTTMFPPTQIVQISGHRNLQSVNNYSQISESQHKRISSIITSRPAQTLALASTPIAANEIRTTHLALPSSGTQHPGNVDRPSSHNVSMTSHTMHTLNSIFGGQIHNSTIHVNIDHKWTNLIWNRVIHWLLKPGNSLTCLKFTYLKLNVQVPVCYYCWY